MLTRKQTRFAPWLLALALSTPGAGSDSVRELDLPSPSPGGDTVRLVVDLEGEARILELRRHSFRSAGFRVRAWNPDGYREVTPPPASTFVGRVEGDPGSMVAGGAGPTGWTLQIETGAGGVYRIRPSGDGTPKPGSHLLLRGEEGFPEGTACGVEHDARAGYEEDEPAQALAGAQTREDREHEPWETGPVLRRDPRGSHRFWCGSSGMKMAEIAYDVDFPYYQNRGSDLAATIANVENHNAVVNAFYARDVLITHEITEIVVRESRFYTPDANNGLLDLFRNEWNANQGGVPRDIAHLMTGQPAPGLAGLAFVAVTCNIPWVYGWSVDSSGVLGHELGHNWSAGHCHDTSPCNNMCGACLYIGPNTKDIIMGYRDAVGCLDDVPDWIDPVPPYAHPDRILLERDVVASRTPVVLDVLANDHDANCDDLTVGGHDDRSLHDGFVDLSVGTGPSDRDQLVYTPPCGLFSGEDTFLYTVEDATGETASASVSVSIRHRSLVGYWPMEDGVDATVTDLTAGAHHGTMQGGVGWGSGPRNGALTFDGIDGSVSAQGPAIEGSEFTLAGWIRRDGAQVSWAGLVFTRAAGSTAGLNFGDAQDLRYHWNGAMWNWNSGLLVPDGQWVFVALVVEPTQGTLYLHDGSVLQSATNVTPHARQTWAGEIRMGEDPTGGRFFRGEMDEIRMYDWALSASEIDALYQQGGRAEAPSPANGGFMSDPAAALSWVPAFSADSHDVYFGSDYFAVRDATPADPAFQANVTGSEWTPFDIPDQGGVYYWRVDTRVGPAVLMGDPWMFTVQSPDPRLEGYWSFEDAPGSTAADVTGRGRDGTLEGGATWAIGPYGGALELDGVDGAVTIPAFNWEGSEATIAAWVRRDGGQAAFAGIVMSREAGTTAALNLGNANELRYHWNDASNTWGWDSGLVLPDGQWVFVALVVEPNQATIYLWDGALQSSVNAVAHSRQTFAGTTWIGRDPGSTARDFRGGIDDVRIYNYALSAQQIDWLISLGGPAESPDPPDGVRLAEAPAAVSWAPGRDADSHDIYIGSDRGAILVADRGSPEFQGNRSDTSFPLPDMGAGDTVYWRIDERVGALSVTGDVWRFSLAEDLGTSLRVRKSSAGEPILTWRELGNSRLYDVQRCEAPISGGCIPQTDGTVGPYQAQYVDPSAPAVPLLWYRVVPQGACAP